MTLQAKQILAGVAGVVVALTLPPVYAILIGVIVAPWMLAQLP